jgi:ornithine lipid hydroxylase
MATVRVILSWSVWPLGLATFIAAITYFADLNDPRSISETVGRTFLVALVVLLGIELVIPYRADWKVRGDRDVWRDLGHFGLYAVGQLLAQVVFILGFVTLLGQYEWRGVWPTEAPLVAQVLLVLIIGDFFEYWLHRSSHALPPLWRVHAIHHMPTRLHMLKAGRHHILYFMLRGLLVWLPLMLIGAPPELIVWQFFGATLTGNIDHANIDFRIPAFAHRLLVTPQFHRIHHSADVKEGNSNFGVMLPFWDMLFGTHVDPVKTQPAAMGIAGDPIPHRLVPELLSPFTRKPS